MKFEDWWKLNHVPHTKDIDPELVEIMKNFSRVAWEAAQPGWHPIETAPKNLGDRIEGFVLLTESGDVIHGGWYKEIDGEGVWFDRFYGEPIDDESITHWMPLPEPPKEREK